jgi:hypothetical protein
MLMAAAGLIISNNEIINCHLRAHYETISSPVLNPAIFERRTIYHLGNRAISMLAACLTYSEIQLIRVGKRISFHKTT